MMLLRSLLPTVLLLLSCSFAAGKRHRRLNSKGNNLPPCQADNFEYNFYTVDTTVRGGDNDCSEIQLETIGILIQDIVAETEDIMPEYKKEYMRAQICPIAEEEDDDRRLLLLESDHRMLANRWTWKGRKGRCKRCRNRTTDRRLSTENEAEDVCRETEKALDNKANAEKSFERIDEMLVSVTEMAWVYGEQSRYDIQRAEDSVKVCEKASKKASSASRASVTLCEQALSEGSASGINRLMKKAEEATKVTEDAVLQAEDALTQVEKMKNEMEESLEVFDSATGRRRRALRRDLGSSSDEDYSVDDVCAQVEVAGFYQTLAEKDLQRAKDTVEAMKEMSKDYSNYKDVQKVLKKAQECCDKVEKERDDTIEKIEKVEEQCEKAREKPHSASKLMKEAKKKTEDVAKEALKANKELIKLKEEEDKMFALAEMNGFHPALDELVETIKRDNEKIEKDIEKIEEEIEEIDEAPKDLHKLLLQKRASYIKQEQELQEIMLNNEKFISEQDDINLGRSNEQSEQRGPVQVILASYNGQTMGKRSWGPNAPTSTLEDWFEKFASLVLGELKKGLPKFNSTAGGCLDGPFGLIVNVTEVEGVLDDDEEVKCDIPEYDDR